MGIEYLLQAAENDCRAAMILVGRAFESGNGIGTKERDWNESVKWYSQSLKTVEVTDDSPEQDYIILARIANMYDTGGYGLAVDYQLAGDHYQQAADTALEQMKGKLANKYYMLAEEAWSKLDE
jgi:elongation factor 2 kinase